MVQSKNVLGEDGKQFHIGLSPDDVGKYVLLPGDPFRTDKIKDWFDNPKLVGHKREHKTWTGSLNGEKVSVLSTGMGGASTAIALEELIHCGAHTFIRVGTCGRVCEKSYDDSLIGLVATAAVRDEGTSRAYIPIEYPAVADIEVSNALIKAYKDRGYKFISGITQSKDSFYGQHDPLSMPISNQLKDNWKAWEMGNVIASEMEASTLFVVSSIREVRAGAAFSYGSMNDETINVAVDALKILIESDKNR